MKIIQNKFAYTKILFYLYGTIKQYFMLPATTEKKKTFVLSDFVKAEVERTYGEFVVRGELTIEDSTGYTKHKKMIDTVCEHYSKYREMYGAYATKQFEGFSAGKAGSHIWFHVQGERVAMFSFITNKEYCTL